MHSGSRGWHDEEHTCNLVEWRKTFSSRFFTYRSLFSKVNLVGMWVDDYSVRDRNAGYKGHEPFQRMQMKLPRLSDQ